MGLTHRGASLTLSQPAMIRIPGTCWAREIPLHRYGVSEWHGQKGRRQQCSMHLERKQERKTRQSPASPSITAWSAALGGIQSLQEWHHQNLEVCTALTRGCHRDHTTPRGCSESTKRSLGHSNSGLVQKCRLFVAILMEKTALDMYFGSSLLWTNKGLLCVVLIPSNEKTVFPKTY